MTKGQVQEPLDSQIRQVERHGRISEQKNF